MREVYSVNESWDDLNVRIMALSDDIKRLRRVAEAAKALTFGDKQGWYELQAALAALEDT